MALRQTLYGKLAAALFALLFLVSLFYIGLTVVTTRLYQQEVSQRLNHDLAANIVADSWLMRDRQVNDEALKAIFHSLMVINPAIELYLVDPDGRILAFSAPAGKVRRDSIGLGPIRDFLADTAVFPILGDDPRDPNRAKIFSVAPVRDGDRLEGYLYVVLGGEAYESVAATFSGSYILRLSAGIGAACLVLALAVGMLSFNWLTRRLRRLSAAMEAFRRSDFRQPTALPGPAKEKGGDEIDQLGAAFTHMSGRIVDQFKELRSADASRRELIANVSHDLRTPLASLQGYLETLLLKEDSLSAEEKHRYLELAANNSRRLGRLVAELFELAMLETNDPHLNFEPFSLGELVQDVSQKFSLEAEKKRLRLATDIPEHAPFVSGDIGLIERVLENLIENAIKYTPEGGEVRLVVVPGARRMKAKVTDTGQGISKADLPRIFDRFYRVEKSRRDGGGGGGLGLAITRRILQLHGSPIDVESAPGIGTTFSFDLPVSNPEPRPAA